MPKFRSLILAGVVTTVLSDLWQRGFMAWIDGSRPDWRGVGRWVLGFRHGRFVDPEVKKRAPEEHENAVGWSFHYIIGVAYAVLYRAGLKRLGLKPSLLAALTFGVLSMAAPMFCMKPAMGGGLCGCHAKRPWIGFFKTLSTHLSFAVGLALTCRR